MSFEPEDLSILARRGQLSDDDERRAHKTWLKSPDALLMHRAGLAFDELDAVEPGDDALFERLLARWDAEHKGPAEEVTNVAHQRARRPRSMRVIGILVSLPALAAAGGWISMQLENTKQQDSNDAIPSALQKASPTKAKAEDLERGQRLAAHGLEWGEEQKVQPALSGQPGNSDAQSMQDNSLTYRRAALRGQQSRESERSGAQPQSLDQPQDGARAASSQELFVQANAARRDGQIAHAITKYQQLIQLYPQTTEALSSHLVLAGLFARSGSANSALLHYRSYLKGNGPLAEEARWGEAQALRALGQNEQAVARLRWIVRNMPHSVYAPAAQRALGELAADTKAP